MSSISKIITYIKENPNCKISDLSSNVSMDTTNLKSILKDLEKAKVIIILEDNGEKKYSCADIITKKREDTYFGLNLTERDENLINYLYTKIKMYWIQKTGREPGRVEVNKSIARINKEYNLNLPIGWYLYGQMCIKTYNPQITYTYDIKQIEKEMGASLSLIENFTKKIIDTYSKMTISQIKKESYLVENKELYLKKTELWGLFANLQHSDTDDYNGRVDSTLGELLVKSITLIDNKILDRYYEYVMDYLHLDLETKIQEQLKVIDTFNTFWQIIALSGFKKSISEKYTKEELDQFDYYILLNIEKLEDTFSDFYSEYKASDLVTPNTDQYKILKIMEETEENLKKSGEYTKDKYDLEVYNKLKQEGYL